MSSCGSSVTTNPHSSEVYYQEESWTWSRPEIAWKEDVCRPYISTLNNAALPVLRSPPEVGCCVALIKHSIKAIPKERLCATMFELGNVAGSDSL